MSHIGNAAAGMTSRQAEKEILLDLLEEMRQFRATSTHYMAQRTGGIVNGVLAVETFTFPARGSVTRSYGAPIGSLVVTNPGTHTVTIHGAAEQPSAPVQGIGVTVLPPASFLTVPVGGPTFTLYGTHDDQVSVQAFSGMEAYGVER